MHLRRVRNVLLKPWRSSEPVGAVSGEPAPIRINVGCGAQPAAGWANLDGPSSVIKASRAGVDHLRRPSGVRRGSAQSGCFGPEAGSGSWSPTSGKFVETYVAYGDADAFLAELRMRGDDRGLQEIVSGFHGHRRMHDAQALERMLSSVGLDEVREPSPGETELQ